MKSQRRHELEHNALADWLGNTIAAIRPYQNLILGVVLLLALVQRRVLVVVVSIERPDGGCVRCALWEALDKGDVNAIAQVYANFPNAEIGQYAGVIAADLLLDSGCNTRFSNKATANLQLGNAARQYQAVFAQSRDPMIRERAKFGLGRARETLNELDEAKKAYEEVLAGWPNGAYAAAARNRLSDLKRQSISDMYDRFAKFDPKPAFSEEPGIPGKGPEFDPNSIPKEGPVFDSPRFKPEGTEPKKPSAEAVPVPPGKPAGPASAKPSDASKPAAGPTATKPAAEPQPGPPAPAASKPAVELPASKPAGAGTARPGPRGTEEIRSTADERGLTRIKEDRHSCLSIACQTEMSGLLNCFVPDKNVWPAELFVPDKHVWPPEW